MYGQPGPGTWQQGQVSWQQTRGQYGQLQQQAGYRQQQGYVQQNQYQQLNQYQQQGPNRQQQNYGGMKRQYQGNHSQQMQQGQHQQHRSHTPNPRPHKRIREDTAARQQLHAQYQPPMPQQQLHLHSLQLQQHYQPPPPARTQQQHPQQQFQQYQQPQHQSLQQSTHWEQQPQQQMQQRQQLQVLRHPAVQQQAAGHAGSAAAPGHTGIHEYPSSNHGNPAAAAWLDRLQAEILRFVQEVAPSGEEEQQRLSCLTAFSTLAQQALPQHAKDMNVTLFGSGAAGLALHHSDLDVAITGLAAPDGDNGGFDETTKVFVVRCLKRIEREALYGQGKYSLGVSSSKLVGRARIPVLKLQCREVELDVSLNDDAGLKAARFLTSFQNDYPATRPLILLLKCALKQRQVADVATGGLGSWSLANMVIAHLMEEDRAGHEADHLGSMLVSFLQRFGVDFNLDRQAVSVKRGGIIAKQLLGQNFTRKEGQLALEDPLTGREVAGGSHRYADVEATFRRLHERLAADLAHHHQGGSSSNRPSSGRSNNGRHIKFQGSDSEEESDDYESYGYDAGNRSPTYQARIRKRRQQGRQQQSEFDLLEMLLDCKAALNRDAGAVAAGGGGGGGRGNGGGGRWQWGNGAGARGPRPVLGRKRDRW